MTAHIPQDLVYEVFDKLPLSDISVLCRLGQPFADLCHDYWARRASWELGIEPAVFWQLKDIEPFDRYRDLYLNCNPQAKIFPSRNICMLNAGLRGDLDAIVRHYDNGAMLEWAVYGGARAGHNDVVNLYEDLCNECPEFALRGSASGLRFDDLVEYYASHTDADLTTAFIELLDRGDDEQTTIAHLNQLMSALSVAGHADLTAPLAEALMSRGYFEPACPSDDMALAGLGPNWFEELLSLPWSELEDELNERDDAQEVIADLVGHLTRDFSAFNQSQIDVLLDYAQVITPPDVSNMAILAASEPLPASIRLLEVAEQRLQPSILDFVPWYDLFSQKFLQRVVEGGNLDVINNVIENADIYGRLIGNYDPSLVKEPIREFLGAENTRLSNKVIWGETRGSPE